MSTDKPDRPVDAPPDETPPSSPPGQPPIKPADGDEPQPPGTPVGPGKGGGG